MSDKKCCVPGCIPQDGARSALHIFPDPNKDIDRFSKWYHAIGGDIVHLENGHIYKYRRVCHKHFEPKYHLRNSRISNIAIPTLHFAEPGQLSSDPVSHSNASGTADSVMPPMLSCSKPKVDNFAVAKNHEPEPSPIDRVSHSNATGTADSVMPPMPSCSKPKDVNKFAVAINLEPEPSLSDRVSHSNATGTADSVMPPMPSCSKSKAVNKAIAKNLDKGILQAECKETADLLLLMDDLFDSVNGSMPKNKHAKPLLGPATLTSDHIKYWRQSKPIFSSMKFITMTGKTESVPALPNWIWTIEAIEVILKNLKSKYGITSIWLRHLNQDPLENFFGAIRSHGCRNNNPTCDQFESAFVALLINNLTSVHSHGKNCEEDFSHALHTLVIEDNNEKHLEAASSSHNVEFIFNINFTPLEEKEGNPRIFAALQYVTGYVLQKLKANIFKQCVTCKNIFETEGDLEYIRYREYAGRRWLNYPSNELILVISQIQDITDDYFIHQFDTNCISESIKTAIYTLIDFEFIKCKTHKNLIIDFISKSFSKFMIFNHCKIINKIVTGRRDVENNMDALQVKAKTLYNTHKRYKNK